MFCKNCGKNIEDDSKFCPYCGNKIEKEKANDNNVCPECNSLRNPGDQYCYHCGHKFTEDVELNVEEKGFTITTPDTKSRKNKIAAALLALFLGYLGIHDFYLGYKLKGLCKLIPTVIAGIMRTIAVFMYNGYIDQAPVGSSYFIVGVIIPAIINIAIGIWSFIDFIMILLNKVTDSDGLLLK